MTDGNYYADIVRYIHQYKEHTYINGCIRCVVTNNFIDFRFFLLYYVKSSSDIYIIQFRFNFLRIYVHFMGRQ